jgi:transposase InsO family protein
MKKAMPFQERSAMSQRVEFCILASKKESNMSNLCDRYKISRRTGYKWLKRFTAEGILGTTERSRRPRSHPNKTNPYIETYVKDLRVGEPEWGSKKLHKVIVRDKDRGIYPYETIPCKTTITRILKRNGLVPENRSKQSEGFERFEYAYPNELWQMDYKGWIKLLNRQTCHPLTIMDDHSRFNICLEACEDQKEDTVRKALENVFRRYGLPYKILADNGGPWGTCCSNKPDGYKSYSRLEKWLMQLNVMLIHGRPYHPQTQGKEERFHRTLKQELFDHEQFRDMDHCQTRFDWWRNKYNCIRPHEAIDLKTPVEIYQPSVKTYNGKIPPYEYNQSDLKRKVQQNGTISFKFKMFKVGKAFKGDYVAIRESDKEQIYEIYFCNQLLRTITL